MYTTLKISSAVVPSCGAAWGEMQMNIKKKSNFRDNIGISLLLVVSGSCNKINYKNFNIVLYIGKNEI
jgi:hypothetical protein